MSYIRRRLAQDDIPIDLVVDEMRFLTVEKLGKKQSLTPEGFLLIEDTPIARSGWQIYAPREIPLSLYPDFADPPDGVFRVKRDDDEVFAPETIASANGKPVVDEHPESVVTPETHAGVPGVMFDVRRGTGTEEDLLIGDLLIYNKDLIQLIRDGKRELSCGYDVDYVELAPGKLAQKNIRINHVALVDSGRCGPRCSIGDHATPQQTENDMAKRSRKTGVLDRIRGVLKKSTALGALSAKDREELENELEKEIPKDAEMEMPEEVEDADETSAGHHIETHVHMPPAVAAEHDDDDDHEERIARLEAAIHELAEMVRALGEGKEPGSEDEVEATAAQVAEAGKEILGQLEIEAPPGAETGDVRGAKDSRYLADSFQATAATAEIIVPGIKLPAFDQKAAPDKSFKVICDLRRSALDLAYNQADTRGMIDDVLGGRAFDAKKMTCDAVRGTFMAVGAMKRSANNRKIRVGDGLDARSPGQPVGAVQNLRDYQKLLDETYNPRKTA